MTLAELVVLAVRVSIVLLVFTVGLGAQPRELMDLVRRPGQFFRAFVSMNVAMPIIAVALVKLFTLNRPIAIILGALALAPVPPILPRKLIKAGGGHAYVMALLFTMSVVAILWTPLVGAVIDRLFPAQIVIPPLSIAKVVVMTVIAPTLAGIVVRLLLPKVAERIDRPLGMLANVLLALSALLILVKAGPGMMALIGNGTLLAIAVFCILGLVVGHLLGGPSPGDRTVLALATASRHPAVALTIAQVVFPNEKGALAAVLLYLIVNAIVTLPYLIWRKKALAAGDAPAVAPSGA